MSWNWLTTNLELELFILGTVFIIALAGVLDSLLDLLEEILADLDVIIVELIIFLLIILAEFPDWMWVIVSALLIALLGLWVALKILSAILRFILGRDKKKVDEDDSGY